MERTILHCDLNNFFASVECVDNPSLKGKNVAVCGNTSERHGIVLAKNTSAKNLGVKTGQAVWQAREKCPDLVVVPPNYLAYVCYSKKIREIYNKYTPAVEAFGMDECWLDLTQTKWRDNPEQFADDLRKEIRDKTGLTISVGVSFNKIFAKLGSDMKKPDATTVVSRDNFKEKVFPLNVDEMLMIGNKTKTALNKFNIRTIGDLAHSNKAMLIQHFGIVGEEMWLNANGLNNSPVVPNEESAPVKSVGHGTTALCDVKDYNSAISVIYTLSEMVATRLRRYAMKAKLIHLDLRYNDLTHLTKQAPLTKCTCNAKDIAQGAVALLRANWNPELDLALRTITVSTAKLSFITDDEQLTMFDCIESRKEKAERAVDAIRQKFGYNSINRGILLNNTMTIDKYCNEDDLLPFKR